MDDLMVHMKVVQRGNAEGYKRSAAPQSYRNSRSLPWRSLARATLSGADHQASKRSEVYERIAAHSDYSGQAEFAMP